MRQMSGMKKKEKRGRWPNPSRKLTMASVAESGQHCITVMQAPKPIIQNHKSSIQKHKVPHNCF